MTRTVAIALTAGLLFGAGLALSGMSDPERVRGFLDLSANWDPTLAFVMIGALCPMAVAWHFHARISRPAAADAFDLPDSHCIDAQLLLGAALFGIRWGVAGLYPGPAVAALALRPVDAAIFIAAMLRGMALYEMANAASVSAATRQTTGAAKGPTEK